jgi:hypothetical protein
MIFDAIYGGGTRSSEPPPLHLGQYLAMKTAISLPHPLPAIRCQHPAKGWREAVFIGFLRISGKGAAEAGEESRARYQTDELLHLNDKKGEPRKTRPRQ